MSHPTDLLTHALQTDAPFAVIRHENSPVVDVYGGTLGTAQTLAQLPLRGTQHRGPDLLAAIPFAQVQELGYHSAADDTPLVYLQIQDHHQVDLEQFCRAFPPQQAHLRQASYDRDDAAYAQMVRQVIDREIGTGQGANFVVRRTLSGHLDGWSPALGVGLFSQLLRSERGAYSTFAVNLGTRVLLGASPERHISAQGGTVMMNPISGTFRLPTQPVDSDTLRHLLEEFLRDEKEILELMMVVDEELKMMAQLCPHGGQVIGPMLKQMSHLVHTEYLLQGHSDLPAVELLRLSMFAATVVGSPVENACRIIARHEASPRGYYGAVLAEIGRDATGAETLDAPILIRTADIAADGGVRMSVGATLVRDSVPEYEVAETRAKLAGLQTALGIGQGASTPMQWPNIHELVPPDSALLMGRNARLSPFWVQDSSADPQHTGLPPRFRGVSLALVSAEDNFAHMLAHLLRRMGVQVNQLTWREAAARPDFPQFSQDILLMGPGPGDPRDTEDPRMATARTLVRHRLDHGQPLVAVCLGHQILADVLGFTLGRQRVVIQGAQRQVTAFGRPRVGGFYNTFTALDTGFAPAGCQISAQEGEVVTLRGPGYAGLQFHPESILTPQGLEILTEILDWVLPQRTV